MKLSATEKKQSLSVKDKDIKVKLFKRKNMIKNNIEAWILLLPLVFLMYIFVWRPTVMGGVWSFFKMKFYTPIEFTGLTNYIQVINDSQFFPTLMNTFKYVFWSLVIGFVPPIIIAIILNEMVHFRNGFRVVIYLPSVIPAIAGMLMWYFIYYPDQTGLFNMILDKFGIEPYRWLNDGKWTIVYICIYMTWQSFAGTMILYYASLQGISPELYEASIIDGAKLHHRVWHITIPQIGGVILLNFVRQIISVFQIMEQPMAMTGGGPNGASISLGYQLYRYGFVSGRIGHAMALGSIMFLILIIMTVFYFGIEKRVSDNL